MSHSKEEFKMGRSTKQHASTVRTGLGINPEYFAGMIIIDGMPASSPAQLASDKAKRAERDSATTAVYSTAAPVSART
jgi:hypothetical protein